MPVRSHGSLSLNRALMAAGLVDRVQVTLFPVITGQTGAGPDLPGCGRLRPGADREPDARRPHPRAHLPAHPACLSPTMAQLGEPALVGSAGGQVPARWLDQPVAPDHQAPAEGVWALVFPPGWTPVVRGLAPPIRPSDPRSATVSDGGRRRLGPGDLLFLDDTEGKGHSSSSPTESGRPSLLPHEQENAKKRATSRQDPRPTVAPMPASVLATIVTVYGLTAGGSSLLQARRMARRGTSEDVSLSFLGMYVAGYALWLVYGLTSGSLPLIIVNVAGVLSGTCTLALALSLRPRRATGAGDGLASPRQPDRCNPPDPIAPHHTRRPVEPVTSSGGPPGRGVEILPTVRRDHGARRPRRRLIQIPVIRGGRG